MIRRLIEWAVKSPLIVILLALALAGGPLGERARRDGKRADRRSPLRTWRQP